ncbi:DUF3499 domain-containing protein [Gordonia sp. Z-3]|uniref:DUF3499 domain-containing protein n=1 Tax=Gordonia aquimaris TaxID=2984863 RepID=A0A9X3D4D2_9ACTN|nr:MULTISPECIES: DUF3499 domain-containing protein [Gordonia]MAU84123.1 hypothetical protein [Gordonia sp. (in: high G+C Gram-positive bacteria)]MCX2964730.1 DUF3499 domain-containing protein [Gordonia aquimaris]MED5800800.1 DUF3499 domain-containing protein [Gordonia sp. Z-3]
MKLPRQCCRPGCARSAVATLTFVYAESTAVIGPLASSAEPHSWDLCDEHARRITVPRGWEMLRSESGFSAPVAEDYELTALAEAVREVGGADRVDVTPGFPDLFDPLDDTRPPGRHRRGRPGVASSESSPSADEPTRRSPHSARPRPGRRGHLRVLPDPID